MADTPLFRAKAPLMLAAAPESQGRLRIGAKDIGLAAALAREVGVAAPLFERAERAVRRGHGAGPERGRHRRRGARVAAESGVSASAAEDRLMHERTIEIATADGRMPTFVTHPEDDGRHPAVVLYMDALGIREELKDMARRIGTVGYYVLLPNLFYRDGGPSFDPALLPTRGSGSGDDAAQPRAEPRPGAAPTPGRCSTSSAREPAASRGAMAAIGWCMGGRHALAAAGTFPDRIKADGLAARRPPGDRAARIRPIC